jgi:hypothetical protein
MPAARGRPEVGRTETESEDKMIIQNPGPATSLSFLLVAGVIAMGCSAGTVPGNNVDGGTSANGDGGVAGDDGGTTQLPSACAVVGGEVKVTQGADAQTFALAWDKDHYVVIYADSSAGSPGIYGLRLDANGMPQAGAVAIAQTSTPSQLPTIAITSSGYFVAWEEGSSTKTVHAQMLGADLHPTGAESVLAQTSSTQARPIAKTIGNGTALAWMDQAGTSEALNVALVDSSMKMTTPNRVAMSDSAGYPWLAGDSASLALLWSDKTGGPYDIHFSPLDMNSLTATANVTVRTGPAGDALLGRMIKTSFGFLAAWEDQTLPDKTHVYMSLLGPDGTKIADGLVEEDVDGNANWPNMAWNGSAAAIVYYEWRTGTHTPQIYMSFVDGTGKRVGGLHDLKVSASPGNNQAKLPDVVWSGTDFGVVWTDTRDGGHSLYFARVDCQS